MAQTRVHGAVADTQFMSADLAYFIVNDGNANSVVNWSTYGYTGATKNDGESLVHLIETVGTLVILDSKANLTTHFAIEAAPGVLAATLQTAIRTNTKFIEANVTVGGFTVA